jgi:hypothetical protein
MYQFDITDMALTMNQYTQGWTQINSVFAQIGQNATSRNIAGNIIYWMVWKYAFFTYTNTISGVTAYQRVYDIK